MKTKVITLFFYFSLFLIYAQQEIEIDLTKNKNGVVTQSVNYAQPINIKLINKLPNEDYEISVEREIVLPDEFKIPKELESDNDQPEALNKPCQDLLDKLGSLNKSKSEQEVAKWVKKINKNLKELEKLSKDRSSKLEDCTNAHKTEAIIALESTTFALSPQKLKQNEQLIVIISRPTLPADNDKDNKKQQWRYVFKTQKKGKWLTTYGFTYISSILKNNEAFFAKQTDDVFTVTELNNRSRLTFVPSIFFKWFPYKDLGKDVSHSFTGGIGYDLEAPTAFLGYSLLYNQNIGVSVGLAGHQQDFLNGRYNEGDQLMENLAENQLNEKLYTVNPYISVTFRFGAAPFQGPTPDATISDN